MRRRRRFPALLLAFSTFFTLFALTGAQATGETAGPVLLGRLAATLFELPRWTPAHREDLQAAALARTTGPVQVEGLPVAVQVPAATALSGDDGQLEAAIAAAAGRRLWDEGRLAFADGKGATGDISLSSPVRWAIGLLEREDHVAWQISLFVALAASSALGLLVTFTSEGGIASMLRCTAFGAAGFALASSALWLVAEVLSGGFSTPVDAEVARIVRDCAWMGLRAGVAVGFVSAAGLLVVRATGQRDNRYAEWPGAVDEPA